MSAFSEIYSKLTEGRTVKVYEMADYCQISAPTLYQILGGRRKPTTRELVIRMARYLELDTEQSAQLLDAYYRACFGEEKYWQRKICRNFLSTTSLDYLSVTIETIPDRTIQPGSIRIAETQGSLAREIFMLCARSGASAKLCLFMPYDFNNLQLVLRAVDSAHPGIEINQIGTFPASLSTAEEIKAYFSRLQAVIRLFFCAKNYSTVMTTSSRSGEFGLFPYFICSDDGVILIRADGEQGAAIYDAQLAALYRRTFEAQLSFCQPLFSKSGSIYDLCAYFGNLQNRGSGDVYIYNRQCCFAPLMSRPMIAKYLNPSIAGQPGFAMLGGEEGVLRFLCAYVDAERTYLKARGQAIYFSESGIRSFLQTGIMFEFPSACWLPLSEQDRATVLELLIENYTAYPYRMARGSLGDPETGFSVFSAAGEGYVQLRYPDGDIGLLSIENPRLLGLLQDYFSSQSQDACYSSQEACEILRRMLDQFRVSHHLL